MNILLLSAYDAQSHRYWRESLVAAFPEYRWQVLSLPPRHFNFRLRTNPLSWLANHGETLGQHYDLIVATSLVDLATLRGICPTLATTPAWLYCHENQFAYPDNPAIETPDAHRVAAQMVFLYSCLSAQAISFNSHWNRDSALAGLRQLSARLPEPIDARLIDRIEAGSNVLPVPLGIPVRENVSKPGQPIRLLWNHRWEYDKGPDQLLAFVEQLIEHRVSCELAIVGQQFRQRPEAFTRIRQLLESAQALAGGLRLSHWGYVDAQDEYQALLGHCDVVLSTALHDFQGLAILEAVAAGAVPLLPNRLAYPELFERAYLYDDARDDAIAARNACDRLLAWQQQGLPAVPDISALSWEAMRPRYQQALLNVSGRTVTGLNAAGSD